MWERRGKGQEGVCGQRDRGGKSWGVIGLGAIGVLVANSAISLGMTVYGYDVNLSIEHALALKNNIITVKTLDEMFAECDYITVHVPLLESTKYLFNADAFAKMKDGGEYHQLFPGSSRQRRGYVRRDREREGAPLCDGFPQRKGTEYAGRDRGAAFGGVDFGKRGQLRRNGGRAAQRLRRRRAASKIRSTFPHSTRGASRADTVSPFCIKTFPI